MQERTTDEGYDQHQETTPPDTTNLITSIPHLIWVMGKLSFIYLLSDSLVLNYTRPATEILITFVKHMF